MGKLYIFGKSSFSELLYYYETVELKNDVAGFCLDKEFITGEEMLPAPLVAFEDIKDTKCDILIGIGYNDMNSIRKKIYDKVKESGCKVVSFVHPTAYIAPNVILGEGCIVLENTTIQPFVKIGICNIFWSSVSIAHHTTIGDFNFFGTMSSVSGDCNVTNYCFLGTNSTLKNGINIAQNTLVGAGTYISRDTQIEDVYAVSNISPKERKSSTYKKI